MIKAPISLQELRRRIYRKAKSDTTHNPLDETDRVSCLRENLTSSSDDEGLETGRAKTPVPR